MDTGYRTGFPGDTAQGGLGPSGLQQAWYTWAEVIPGEEIGSVPDCLGSTLLLLHIDLYCRSFFFQ